MYQLLVISGLVALTWAHSPVVMWPAKQFELTDGYSPLESLSPEKFGNMIANQKLVVFAKKGFSLEDLSLAPRAPSYLDSQELAALQSVHNLHGLLKQEVKKKNIHYVVLEDDDIMKNDAIIQQYMEKYKGYAGMIVTTPIHKISARAAGDEKPASGDDKPVCAEQTSCGMVYILSATNITSCTVACEGKGLNLTLGDAVFTVTEAKGGFTISSEEYKIESDITWFPDSFSYSCGKFVAVNRKDSTKVLELDTFQMYLGASPKAFPPITWDCAVWLTTPVIMGLVVVLFYLSILFGAVLFLLDIKTNDRFDDPKGKTITVNISE